MKYIEGIGIEEEIEINLIFKGFLKVEGKLNFKEFLKQFEFFLFHPNNLKYSEIIKYKTKYK